VGNENEENKNDVKKKTIAYLSFGRLAKRFDSGQFGTKTMAIGNN
jgi:hypothetical protein